MQRMNEWPVFSIFRHRASCQSVTWSTPCLPSSQAQAEPCLASVRWESMGGPERGHLCCAEQKRTWTSYSAEGTVTIFLAAKTHKWMFCQYSKLKPELISAPTFNGGFFPHSSITLSLQWPLRLSLTTHSTLFPTLFVCPKPVPIGYHLTWQRVLGSTQWQRHISPLSFDTSAWPELQNCGICFNLNFYVHTGCTAIAINLRIIPTIFFFSVLAFLCTAVQEISLSVCPTDTAVQSLHKFYLIHLFVVSPVCSQSKVVRRMCHELLKKDRSTLRHCRKFFLYTFIRDTAQPTCKIIFRWWMNGGKHF